MDIKDSNREAFEVWFESQLESTKLHKINGVYLHERAQMAWKAWQAAKAQAIPDGFVLMPKEPTQEIIQAGLDVVRESWDDNPPHGFNSFMWGDMVATWEAMIEAQEPAND